MERMSTTFETECTGIKIEKYFDAEDSDDENLTDGNEINDVYSKFYGQQPTTLEEPIRVDPTAMSENAIKLIRKIEKSLEASETECSSDVKTEIKVEKNNSYFENESRAISQNSAENTTIDPFAPIPKYIFGPKPPKNPGLFDCNKCSMNFESLDRLNKHNISRHIQKTGNKKRPYVCDICDGGFKLFQDLVNHRKCRHRMLHPLYQSITGITNEEDGNEQVKKVITDVDEWVPDSTIGDGNLGYDGKEKSGVPPKYIFGPKPPERKGLFSCYKCSKNLATQENLDRHNLLTHTRKIPNPSKPHVCNVCDKEFYTIRKMMHHKIHLHKIYNPQYKMYKKQMEELEIMKQEPKNSPAPVPKQGLPSYSKCPRTFADEKESKNQFQTSPLPFICNICNKGFRMAKGLETHRKAVHRI